MTQSPFYLTFTVHPLTVVRSLPRWEANALPPIGKLSLGVKRGTRPQDLTARRVLRALRERGYLHPATAGEFTLEVEDPDVLLVVKQGSRKPVLCLRADLT